MESLVRFFAMGGYAQFVWPAYGAAALVILALLIDSVGSYRRRRRELEMLERARGGKAR